MGVTVGDAVMLGDVDVNVYIRVRDGEGRRVLVGEVGETDPSGAIVPVGEIDCKGVPGVKVYKVANGV